MTEQWRPIDGFEGFYEVSDLGRVRSLARTIARPGGIARRLPTRLMTGSVKDNGYVLVSLRKPGEKQVKKLLQRLVALAFLPRPRITDEVNHRDGDKLNNRVGNLEWCTHAENMTHAWETGLLAPPPGAGAFRERCWGLP